LSSDDKKDTPEWTLEGVTSISRHSVVGANKYKTLTMPAETVSKVMGGREPKLLMDIHSVSNVNSPAIDLSELNRPATSADFNEA
jgi:NADH-quinone oxidoreductase subunit G